MNHNILVKGGSAWCETHGQPFSVGMMAEKRAVMSIAERIVAK